MNEDKLTRLASIHPAWAPVLTAVSCASLVATVFSPILVLLAMVTIPLAIAAALQVTAVAPLARELDRLRTRVAELEGADAPGH